MASRAQQKSQPGPRQPGLKVVEKQQGASAPDRQGNPPAEKAAAPDEARQSAASRRRLHPPRVWPD